MPLSSTDIEARLEALETKVSFADDLLDQLNLLVYRQRQQIDQLAAEVSHLRQAGAPGDGAEPTRSARDELPPHY